MNLTLDGLTAVGTELTEKHLDQATGGLTATDVVVILILIAFFP
jgi:hypothetical protein